MLLSKELEAAINQQIGNEFAASMQYIQIAAYFDSRNMANLTGIIFDQAEEEIDHAMKFVHYLLETWPEFVIPTIAAPQPAFSTAAEAVNAALIWEKEVTKQVYNLVAIAEKDKDYISLRFLDWFVDEQLEEINKMDTIKGIIENAGEKNLFMVDNYIKQALPADPTAG